MLKLKLDLLKVITIVNNFAGPLLGIFGAIGLINIFFDLELGLTSRRSPQSVGVAPASTEWGETLLILLSATICGIFTASIQKINREDRLWLIFLNLLDKKFLTGYWCSCTLLLVGFTFFGNGSIFDIFVPVLLLSIMLTYYLIVFSTAGFSDKIVQMLYD